MNAYAIVNSQNEVESMISWNDKVMPNDYPIPDGCKVLKISEGHHDKFMESIHKGKKIKILPGMELKYEIQDIVESKQIKKPPSDIELIQEKLNKAESDNITLRDMVDDMYKQLLDLKQKINK
jgi:hypothetical protein